MVESRTQFSKPVAFLRLLRPNRGVMVAMITGAAAFAAGAGDVRSLWMTLAGWCLAVGGFSLDFYADRDLEPIRKTGLLSFLSFPRKRESINDADKHGFRLSRE